MISFDYSRDYNPPAPMVDATLSTAAEGLRVGPLPFFVDSGADGTIVPLAYLERIQAPLTDEMRMRSQWGERRRVYLYLVDIHIGDLTLPSLEVVGDPDSDEAILGRDALNQLRVLLDGLGESVEIGP